jgi:protein-disulfide isomerase
VNKRIERQVREHFNVPAGVEISIGERKPSEFPNYETLPITFNNSGRVTTHDFLLSKDGKTLIRMTKVDVSPEAYAQTVKKETEARKQQLELMKKIDLTGRPFRGAKDAPVSIVVFDDYQCPYCASMYRTLFDDVMKTHADKVKVIYKDYPLFEIHPWAKRAAVNSNCLAEKSSEAFWDFSDYVHAKQREVSGPSRDLAAQSARLDSAALGSAKKFSVDPAAVQACLKAQPDAMLKASVKEAESLGVSATPTLFVNGEKLEGAVDAAELRRVINTALADAGYPAPTAAADSKAPPPAGAPPVANK